MALRKKREAMQRFKFIVIGAIATLFCGQSINVSAAGGFTSPAFYNEWHHGEVGIPNFWGPLSTARDGVMEPYKEAPGGQRVVQYFDKTRMELTNPATGTVTNGLLTVEMATGQVQIGDASFDTRSAARTNVAGDPGSTGVTYADLALAPKHPDPNATGNGTPQPWVFNNGTFNPRGDFQYKREGNNYVPVTAGGPFYAFDALGSTRPVRIEGGPYGHWVYGAFVRFLQPLATSVDRAAAVVQTVGYPITPYFFAQTTIKGVPQWVIVQAFERRVLTMTADGLVEFGNIGQHYYQWRYGSNAPMPATIRASIPDPPVDFSAFAQRWGSHGFQLVVGADGYAHAQSRTYEQCDRKTSDPNIPCEDPYTSYAAHAIIRFTSVSGDTASGTVLSSNLPLSFPTNSSVTLTRMPYDIANLTSARGSGAVCGPDYPSLAPPSLRATSPCGA